MPNALQRLFLPLYRVAHWPDGVRYQHEQRRWMLDHVFTQVPLGRVSTVVEVGCGDGWVCRQLSPRFRTVVGFDINPLRIDGCATPNVLLVAGNAGQPPIGDGTADLILSLSVLEHLPDRVGALKQMRGLLKPGGVMIHLVPVAAWKVLQWIGFGPDWLRKQARGLTRAMAGQRKPRSTKYYQNRETNNPARTSRRRWHQKIMPRVHGEYDSNWQEFTQWTDRVWTGQFTAAGLRVVRRVPLGLSSPYGFGCFGLTKPLSRVGLASIVAYVLEPAPADADR